VGSGRRKIGGRSDSNIRVVLRTDPAFSNLPDGGKV
jgi:hypothetical protein